MDLHIDCKKVYLRLSKNITAVSRDIVPDGRFHMSMEYVVHMFDKGKSLQRV